MLFFAGAHTLHCVKRPMPMAEVLSVPVGTGILGYPESLSGPTSCSKQDTQMRHLWGPVTPTAHCRAPGEFEDPTGGPQGASRKGLTREGRRAQGRGHGVRFALAPEQPGPEDSPGCLGGPGFPGDTPSPPERQSEGGVFLESRTATREETGLRERQAQAPPESWLPASKRGCASALWGAE